MRHRSIQAVWLTNAAALTLAALLITRFVIGTGWLPSWLIAVNAVAFALYGWDKRLARGGGLRIPEIVLQTLALAGGSPGALGGQRFFRHKTAKRSFQSVFWLILSVQVATLAWWYWPQ